MAKIRVLFLEANPLTTNQSGLEEKVRTIRHELQHFRNLVFDLGWAAGVDDLKGELEFYPSDVVHFVGHGTGEGIVMSKKAGDMKAISDEALALRFSRFSPRTRLVILDGCYTIEQAKALTDVVDCVIGISNQADAGSILWFIMLLYRNISEGCSIQEAINQSRAGMPSSVCINLLGKKPMAVLLPSNSRSQSTTGNRELVGSLAMGIDLEQDIPTVWLSHTPSYIPFKRRKVFICYYKCLEDEKWLQRLQAHLAPLECEGVTEPWGITNDPVDAELEQELQITIETAKVVILLEI